MKARLILVSGGAGFIGSNFVLRWVAKEKPRIPKSHYAVSGLYFYDRDDRNDIG